LPWLQDKTVFEEKTVATAGAKREVVMKQFDLTDFLNAKEGKHQIVGLRLTAEVVDSAGNLLSSEEKIIAVQLGD
jgi:hypothetical protein